MDTNWRLGSGREHSYPARATPEGEISRRFQPGRMVLPKGIEPLTSALPRMPRGRRSVLLAPQSLNRPTLIYPAASEGVQSRDCPLDSIES